MVVLVPMLPMRIRQASLRSWSRLFSVLVRSLGACALLLFCGSCSWSQAQKPSILVILVENLGFNAFSCGDGLEEGRSSGYQAFCEEAVRFTHAYTPSVLSQPTIASIFTAKFPFEHGLRHNGAQALSAKEVTFAEAALTKGYRTSFFSGGPPVWRRSGLNQGFEVFDDSVNLSLKSLYRNAADVGEIFLNWQETEASRDRFASFLYFADLQFIDQPTTNELGELRSSSYQSQVDEVDEALDELVREMKRRKIWDSTDVFLVGLQGATLDVRIDEIPLMSLLSETTRSTLMVKPARLKRDGPFNWKIDSNVSLTDVGTTLFEMIGLPRKSVSEVPLTYSLLSALKGPEPDWPSSRFVVSESAWAEWRGFGSTRAAVRQGPNLFLFDERPLLFNTLTDSREATPLPNSDFKASAMKGELSDYLNELKFSPWRTPSREVVEKFLLARQLWRDREPPSDVLTQLASLAKQFPQDFQLQAWRAIWALRNSDWTTLKDVGAKPGGNELWTYVAARNLNEKQTPPTFDPCLDFLRTGTEPWTTPKACRVDGLSDLLTWANESLSEGVRNRAMESFLRLYLAKALAARVSESNLALGLKWDASSVTDVVDPLDLYLSLPELKKQKAIARARLASERRVSETAKESRSL